VKRTKGQKLNRQQNPNAFQGRKLAPEMIRRVVDNYLTMEKPEYKSALVRAGYAPRSASKVGYRFFQRPDVQAYMQKRQAELSAQSGVAAEDLIRQLRMIAFGDLSKFIVVQKDGTLSYDFSNATQDELRLINDLSVDLYSEGRGAKRAPVKKFKLSTRDQLRAIELLGRIIGAFQDKVNIAGEVSLVERLQQGRAQVKE